MLTCLRTLRHCLAAAVLTAIHGHAAAMDVAILDRPANDSDRRHEYGALLLRTVLEYTVPAYGPYRLEWSSVPMERTRLLNELRKGKYVNVATIPANKEWLASLLSVPIPVDLGLQSWRLLLIDRKNQDRLQQLAATGQLRLAVAGSHGNWTLRQVLRENGYDIVSGNSYTGLFHMLRAGRFDYLPRGVHEIFPEYAQYRSSFPTLAIEENLVLKVPIPSLFFISPREKRLQQRIAAGMETMLKDGSLERLVLSYYRHDLERAGLCRRVRITLSNSALDPAMEARQELWFDPFDPRHNLCLGVHTTAVRSRPHATERH